jgi:hypothetical protein
MSEPLEVATMRRVLPLIALFLFLACDQRNCQAQDEDSPRIVRDRELVMFIARWNRKQVTLVKQELTGAFVTSLKELAEGKPPEWFQARFDIWDKLPATLEPEKSIAFSGASLLRAMYSENDEQFYKRVPDEGNRRHLVDTKLYLIMSLAQDSASRLKKERIEASDIFTAIARAWTGLWPFCPTSSVPLQ